MATTQDILDQIAGATNDADREAAKDAYRAATGGADPDTPSNYVPGSHYAPGEGNYDQAASQYYANNPAPIVGGQQTAAGRPSSGHMMDGTPPPDDQRFFNTPNGMKSFAQLKMELQAANYPGPWDASSMLRAYITAIPAATAGAVSGGQASQNGTRNVNPGSAMGPNAQAIQQQQGGQQGANQTPDWYTEYLKAENERKIKEAEEEKRRWELQHALSKNADERAAAQLHIAEANQKLAQAQFETSKQQFNQNLYSGLAQSLMQGAASLRGPRDYAAYQRYTGQGRSLVNQLYGDTRPAFSANDTAYGGSYGIGDILGDLGMGTGGTGAAGGGIQGRVPTPQSINPANWDALSQSGRDLLLGLAADPQAGGYDANDYQATINASRPMGQAPTGTRSRFASPTAVF